MNGELRRYWRPWLHFPIIQILYDLIFPWCLLVLRVQSAGRQWNPRKTPSYYLNRLLGRRLMITWFFLTARESKVSGNCLHYFNVYRLSSCFTDLSFKIFQLVGFLNDLFMLLWHVNISPKQFIVTSAWIFIALKMILYLSTEVEINFRCIRNQKLKTRYWKFDHMVCPGNSCTHELLRNQHRC